MQQLQGPLSGGACWQGFPQNRGQPTWRLLRRSWDSPRRTVRLATPTLDNRYDVRRAQTSGTGTDKQHFPRDLLHQSGKSIRLGRSCAIMGSTCPFWSSASDDQGHPHVSRWYEDSRTGAPARMCVVAAVVQYLLCGGHHSGPAEVRGGPADRFGLGVPR